MTENKNILNHLLDIKSDIATIKNDNDYIKKRQYEAKESHDALRYEFDVIRDELKGYKTVAKFLLWVAGTVGTIGGSSIAWLVSKGLLSKHWLG